MCRPRLLSNLIKLKKHYYSVCQNDETLKFLLWKKLVYSSVNSIGLNWKARSSCKPNNAFQDNRLYVSNECWSICLPTPGLRACLLRRTGISLKYILINTCYKTHKGEKSLSKTFGVWSFVQGPSIGYLKGKEETMKLFCGSQHKPWHLLQCSTIV